MINILHGVNHQFLKVYHTPKDLNSVINVVKPYLQPTLNYKIWLLLILMYITIMLTKAKQENKIWPSYKGLKPEQQFWQGEMPFWDLEKKLQLMGSKIWFLL